MEAWYKDAASPFACDQHTFPDLLAACLPRSARRHCMRKAVAASSERCGHCRVVVVTATASLAAAAPAPGNANRCRGSSGGGGRGVGGGLSPSLSDRGSHSLPRSLTFSICHALLGGDRKEKQERERIMISFGESDARCGSVEQRGERESVRIENESKETMREEERWWRGEQRTLTVSVYSPQLRTLDHKSGLCHFFCDPTSVRLAAPTAALCLSISLSTLPTLSLSSTPTICWQP